MKVLYAIQGTGNGHVARAREIIPLLQGKCQLDILISGTQADISLPFPIKYQYKGLSFVFGKRGGVDLWQSYMQNRMRRIWKEVNACPTQNYDLVINDFEPISAWSSRNKGVPCASLSHQCAVLARESPKPLFKDPVGLTILSTYAPSDEQYGFHFKRYNPRIFTPVIRQSVRALRPEQWGHYTVYLPAYNDALLAKHLGHFHDVEWQVFSKHNKKETRIGNVHLRPISNEGFVESMATCTGLLCGAGFETPAEALFLGKKILVIPMKGQFEQHCNAAAMAAFGVPVIKALSPAHYGTIAQWLQNTHVPPVDFPDETDAILNRVLNDFRSGGIKANARR